MSDLYWCPNCKANRYAKVDYNKTIMLILLVLGIFVFVLWIVAAIYLVYCFLEKKKCKTCGLDAELLEPPRFEGIKTPNEE